MSFAIIRIALKAMILSPTRNSICALTGAFANFAVSSNAILFTSPQFSCFPRVSFKSMLEDVKMKFCRYLPLRGKAAKTHRRSAAFPPHRNLSLEILSGMLSCSGKKRFLSFCCREINSIESTESKNIFENCSTEGVSKIGFHFVG